MSYDGDYDPAPINFPGISYSPGYEAGITWATQYTSELGGALALSQGMYYLSNFLTRDIAGRTAGICVNPWDFNFVKARPVGTGIVGRPADYTRTSFQECDCSYHKCDRQFQGLGYTLDFGQLWGDSENPQPGKLAYAFVGAGGLGTGANSTRSFDSIGFPKALRDPASSGNYENNFGGSNPWVVEITPEKIAEYKTALAAIDQIPQGTKETNLLTYALIDFCQSVTGGLLFKNNIISLLAFAQETLVVSGDFDYGDIANEGDAWSAAAAGIINNYLKNADIPGFDAEFIYRNIGSSVSANIQERCMCLDGGMYGYDAYPFADNEIVIDQLKVEGDNVGGIDKFQLLGFEGGPRELAEFLTIDGNYLKSLGVTGAKDYKYGPNWAYGTGFSDLNVVSVSTPRYKNWEVRDSGKIRLSGTPNGEPYSLGGRQWLTWAQRIGVPPIEYVPMNPITLGGGDFVDPNFGYKGNLQGSMIYKGRLKADVLAYESQDYEYAFLGASASNGFGTGREVFFGLTTIRHIDAITNEDTYGISGSIEDIVFSDIFSESPQDKTIYRL